MQDARGFFFVCIVFGFSLFGLLVCLFSIQLSLLVLLTCSLVVCCFFFCLFSSWFLFILLSLLVFIVSALDCSLSLVSVPEYDSKKRGGTQVQIASRTDRLLVRYRSNCCMEWEWGRPGGIG